MKITALGLASLLIPQTLPMAMGQQGQAGQQPATQQTAGQQQAAPVAAPALPPALPDVPQGQSSSQDAYAELPSAPVPQYQSSPQQQQQADPQQQQQPPALPEQQQPAPSQQQQQPPALPQQPVGTAAAPAEKPTGVPGSRPSGVAIAPAKQRRVRALVISLGLVLAAGVAIGATAGLSKASHSTPQ